MKHDHCNLPSEVGESVDSSGPSFWSLLKICPIPSPPGTPLEEMFEEVRDPGCSLCRVARWGDMMNVY